MKLSIIVPVYNVERYLMRCLESILGEMCDDYELILVDDGSADMSGKLCDDFAAKHGNKNITVVHQNNGGLSAARNQGIDIAKGDYITFVDSDDYVDSLSIRANMSYLLAHPEVEILEYPVEVHAESSNAYMLTFQDETLYADVFNDWIRRQGYEHCYACNKIYAVKVWKEIRFPIEVCFEDVAVMPDVIRKCHCIHYSSLGCYRYVLRPKSITTSYEYINQCQLFDATYSLYLKIKDDNALSTQIVKLWVSCLNRLVDIGRCADVNWIEFNRLLDDVHNSFPSYNILKKSTVDTKTIVKLISQYLFGVKNYCRILITFLKPLSSHDIFYCNHI